MVSLILLWIETGLLTVAIVHANNARDIDADAKAGLTTMAMKLGKERSYWLHCALMWLSYGLVVLHVFTPTVNASTPDVSRAAPAEGDGMDLRTTVLPSAVTHMLLQCSYTTCRQLIVLLNLPWCLYITRLFASNQMKELPQKVSGGGWWWWWWRCSLTRLL